MLQKYEEKKKRKKSDISSIVGWLRFFTAESYLSENRFLLEPEGLMLARDP